MECNIIPDSLQPSGQENYENQILFNGRMWRNMYFNVRGNQFLFSDEFQPGTLMMNGRLFGDLRLLYDIYSDEILTRTPKGIIVQLNKEMVNEFTFDFNNNTYYFLKQEEDEADYKGYVNVLYSNNLKLFVKYKKDILLLAEEKKYDAFFQYHRIFLLKDGKTYLINNKNNVIRLFPETKHEIRNFIRGNKLKMTKKEPASFIPLIEFIDKLNR
jgi:hypothetical protein